MKKVSIFIAFFVLFSASQCFAQVEEGKQHLTVKKGGVSCDIGVYYKKTPDGIDVEVAAIGTGRGSSFRKYEVSKIILSINGKRIRPTESDFCYATEETFLKWPGAILFGYIGARSNIYEHGLAEGIDRVGMAGGLGGLGVAATGQLTGLKAVFKLDGDLAAGLDGKDDKIRITLVNIDSGNKVRLKSDLPRVNAD